MSGKQSRHSPSLSSPHSSKLPKFLQKSTSRDRSKSVAESPVSGSGGSSVLGAGAGASAPSTDAPRSKNRPSSRIAERPRPLVDVEPARADDDTLDDDDLAADTPVIIEPIPRPRTRSSESLQGPGLYPSPATRLGELPNRLSGWFSHTFSSSTTDLTLPNLLSQAASFPASPKSSKTNPLITAAKHGKGHLDKAMRYLLDSDATPDKCPDPIWLLGVEHPGYEAPPPGSPSPSASASSDPRSSTELRRSTLRSSSSTSAGTSSESLALTQPPSKHPGAHWPPVFYADYTTRIWCTYRSHFAPIRDTALSALESEIGQAVQQQQQQQMSSSPQRRWWGGEKGWTSDAGWGCMLRTGQSLLANGLLHLHLGRDWRVPPRPVLTADFAMYVRMLTWFFDSPSPLCPFSVHRMALAGKELGKDVGQWFGPSTAAGAIKTLVHMFPEAGLGVAVAVDSVIYQSDVFAASHGPIGPPRRHRTTTWGSQGVLVLVGIRLGLDGVNPIYYDTIKTLYTFPQSVGIAGGRPSSSYYFVGSQADNLFYLDPHHARPAIPLRPPPAGSGNSSLSSFDPLGTASAIPISGDPNASSSDREQPEQARYSKKGKSAHLRSPTSPTSPTSPPTSFGAVRSPGPPSRTSSLRSSSGGSARAFSPGRSPASPSPLQQTLSASSASGSSAASQHARYHTSDGAMDIAELSGTPGQDLDPAQLHFATAYSAAELRTFHCDRVRKMPLSGLDPSMLIGFLCKDESDWKDLRARLADLSKNHKTIFSIQDEPPTWPSDTDSYMGLESFSDPDGEADMPEDEVEGDGDGAEEDEFFDAGVGRDSRSPSTSPDPDLKSDQSSSSRSKRLSKQSARARPGSHVSFDDDSEDEGVDPVTPGPGRTSFTGSVKERDYSRAERTAPTPPIPSDDDIEDDWVDPSLPTPQQSPEERTGHGRRSASASSSSSTRGSPSTLSGPVPLQLTESSKTVTPAKSRKGKGAKTSSVPVTPIATEPSYPFPVTQSDETPPQSRHGPVRERLDSRTEKRVPQMRTAKAKDGGRTRSGGVRGIPTDES